MAKKKQQCEKGAPKWMVTFTDMNMLLLTFFVLLLSMATLDQRKIREALGSLQGALGVLQQGTQTEISPDTIITRLNLIRQERKVESKTMNGMRNYVQSANLSKMISVVKTEKGISVRIIDAVLFENGRAQLLPQARPILDQVAALAEDAPYNITVEGHTDDTPINTPEFESNWELSTARAVAVVRYLADQGVSEQKLGALGYAENHPLLPNITNANRAKNRRVEINFISPEFAESNKNYFEEDENGGNR